MKHFEKSLDTQTVLNPMLWDNETLRPKIRKTLIKIAQAYYKFLSLDIPVVDVVISGSQANFNYTKHSDIDLHLIVDYSKVNCDMDVDELFDTKRVLWKEQHDIKIHTIPVEVYVEDVNKPAVSSSYSLLKNKWINKPKYIEVNVDEDRVYTVTLAFMKLITSAIKSENIDYIDRVREMIWTYRKIGLKKSGEMGVPNLVFKSLRNSGASEMLLDALNLLRDRELSLENQN